MNTDSNQGFFLFRSEGFMTTFTVDADIYENAFGKDDPDSLEKRRLYDFLLDGNYPEWLEFPVVFRERPHDSGKKLRDIIGPRLCPCLISERLKALLEENGITGWKSYPVEIYDRKGELVTGYHGFSITGRGGSVRYKDPEKQEGGIYDSSQWDGSDFFRVKPYYTLVTARVKALMKDNKISAPRFWTDGLEWIPANPACEEEKKRKKKEIVPPDSKGLCIWLTNLLPIGTKIARLPDAYIDAYTEQCGGYIADCLVSGDYPDWLPFPLPFHLIDSSWETYLGDIMNTGIPNFILISKHLEEFFLENGFTGWKTYPVQVFNEGILVESPFYRGLSITGRGGYVVNEKMKRKRKRTYDTSQWDGSDFFLVKELKDGEVFDGLPFLMVTKKAAKLIHDSGVKTIFNTWYIDEWN